jgi:hypothetical protein
MASLHLVRATCSITPPPPPSTINPQPLSTLNLSLKTFKTAIYATAHFSSDVGHYPPGHPSPIFPGRYKRDPEHPNCTRTCSSLYFALSPLPSTPSPKLSTAESPLPSHCRQNASPSSIRALLTSPLFLPHPRPLTASPRPLEHRSDELPVTSPPCSPAVPPKAAVAPAPLFPAVESKRGAPDQNPEGV